MSSKSMQLYESLLRLFKEKKYKECILICKETPELFNSSATEFTENLYFIFAKSYYKQNLLEDASLQLAKGLKDYPNSRKLIKYSAFSCQKLGDWSKAEEYWLDLLKLYPQDLNAHINLALCYLKSGLFNKAEEILLALKNRRTESKKLYNNLTYLLSHEKDSEQSLIHWQMIAKIFSDCHDIQFDFTEKLVSKKIFSKAAELLNNTISENDLEKDTKLKVYIRLIEIYGQMNKEHLAIEWCLKGIKEFSDNEILLKNLANNYEKCNKWLNAKKTWNRLIELDSSNIEALIARAHSLLKLNQFIKAKKAYLRIGEMGEQFESLKGLAEVYEKQWLWENALKQWDKIIAELPRNKNAYLRKAQVFQVMYKFSDAKESLEFCMRQFDNFQPAKERWLELCISTGDYKKAKDFIDGETSDISLNMKLLKADIMLCEKLYENAVTYLQNLSQEYSDNPEVLIKLADVNLQLLRNKEVESTWLKIMDSFTLSDKNIRKYISLLLKFGEVSKADKLFENIEHNKSIQALFLKNSLLNSKKLFNEAEDLLEQMSKRYPQNLQIKYKYATSLLNDLSSERFIKGLKILEDVYKESCGDVRTKIRLAEAYITNGNKIKALELIDSLDSKTMFDNRVVDLVVWARNEQNKFDEAKNIWKKYRVGYTAALEAPLGTIKLVKESEKPHKNLFIPLFSLMRNEASNLPWFLKHYRDLGVSHFFIIDNDSTDDTHGYLLEQPDVFLFWTSDSFSANNSGMRWINHLLDTYASDCWSLYVDADEMLLFPFCDRDDFKLPQLINYMDKNNEEAMFTFMLDMYGENATALGEYKTGLNPLQYAKYFDNNYFFTGKASSPFIRVKGGVMNRVFGDQDTRTKTPIVNTGKGIRFVHSSHTISPAIISKTTGVLLHFKLLGDLLEKAEEAVRFKERVKNGKRFKNYISLLNDLGDVNYVYNESIEYNSTRQLMDLELIRTDIS